MGFESAVGCNYLYRDELPDDLVIDAHQCAARVAIDIHRRRLTVMMVLPIR